MRYAYSRSIGLRRFLGSGGLGAGGGGEPEGFTPDDLFASAEAGGWYDPSDLSTLWQDTGGTVQVTADGQNVARIDDKSGNGNHATQATSSLRPVWKTGGYLLYDGVDDYLDHGFSSFAAMTYAGRFRTPDGTTGVAFLGVRDASDQRSFIGTKDSGTAADTFFGGGVGSQSTGTIAGTTFIGGTDFNGVMDYNGTTVNLYVNNTNEYSAAQSGSGDNTTNNIWSGGLNDSGSLIIPANCRIYELIVTDDLLTSDERADLDSHLTP